METGRRLRRGQAANPGTGRTPIVPLLGLAPGGVWPPLRHRRRPDALTVRFHPYPPGVVHRSRPVERTVCFCATFRPRPGKIPAGAWELPSTLSSGARTFLLPGPLGRRSPSPHESSLETVASPWLEGQVGGGLSNCSNLVGRIGRRPFSSRQSERQQRGFAPDFRTSDPRIPLSLNSYWPDCGRSKRPAPPPS